MKFNGTFSWQGISGYTNNFRRGTEETQTPTRKVEGLSCGPMAMTWEVELTPGELIDILKAGAEDVKLFMAFAKNDLPEVIRENGAAVSLVLSESKNKVDQLRNTQLVNYARAWKEARDICGEEVIDFFLPNGVISKPYLENKKKDQPEE